MSTPCLNDALQTNLTSMMKPLQQKNTRQHPSTNSLKHRTQEHSKETISQHNLQGTLKQHRNHTARSKYNYCYYYYFYFHCFFVPLLLLLLYYLSSYYHTQQGPLSPERKRKRPAKVASDGFAVLKLIAKNGSRGFLIRVQGL